MTGFFEYLRDRIFRFRVYNRIFDDPLRNKTDSIYSKNCYATQYNLGNYVKQQNKIHRFLKYLIIVPFVKFVVWIMGKHLVTSVPKESQHLADLRLFSEVYERSLVDWINFYMSYKGDGVDGYIKCGSSFLVRYLQNRVTSLLRSLKNLVLTVLMNDSAFLPFFHFLMFNWSKAVCDKYHGTVEHIMYKCQRIDDVRYFLVIGDVPAEVKPLVTALVNGKVQVQQSGSLQDGLKFKEGFQL